MQLEPTAYGLCFHVLILTGMGHVAPSIPSTSSKKIEIPNGKVGVIIGDGRENIRYIQQQSGATIHITGEMDADFNSLTGDVEIVGTADSIAKAELLIKDVLAAEAESREFGTVSQATSNARSQKNLNDLDMEDKSEPEPLVCPTPILKSTTSNSNSEAIAIVASLEAKIDRLIQFSEDERIASDLAFLQKDYSGLPEEDQVFFVQRKQQIRKRLRETSFD
ncbi:putative K domain-containing protein [Helianthus debilis subsp. tardiflorus]